MILVDTSVWVAHLHQGQPRLTELLQQDQVITHPFVIGELACGHVRRRTEVLSYLDRLARAPQASDAEARGFLETHQLMGQGLGWIDIHLLASCRIATSLLWSLDRRLAQAAARLRIAA